MDEVLPDPRGHHEAPGTEANVDRVRHRPEQLGQSRLPHPVAQVQGVAAVHEQDVGLPDPRDPAVLVDAGERRELQDPDGLPAKLDHRRSGFLPGDEPPGVTGVRCRVPVGRGRDAECVALGNGFAQHLDEGVLDAAVLDAGRSEKELHMSPSSALLNAGVVSVAIFLPEAPPRPMGPATEVASTPRSERGMTSSDPQPS